MKRSVEGEDRSQVTLLPECLADYVEQDNPVRVAEACVEQLDLRQMDFGGVAPRAPRRPAPGGRPEISICQAAMTQGHVLAPAAVIGRYRIRR